MASDRIRRDNQTKTVILDSSAVLMLFEQSIDLENELLRLIGNHTIVIPTPVTYELKGIAHRGDGKKSQHAKAALKLIEKYQTINSEKKGDEALLDIAKKMNCIVVTNDKELRKRLKNIPVPVIFLRGKHKLEIE